MTQLDTDILGMDPAEFWASFSALALASLAGLYLGFRWFRRLRLIEDTPTSRLRSAAQGYVELFGWGDLMPGEPIIAPLSGRRCTWWRYHIEERRTSYRNGRSYTTWETIDRGVSDGIFLLCDDTGHCVVDPEHAEVTPSAHVTWYGSAERPSGPPPERSKGGTLGMLASVAGSLGGYRYTEMRMHPGDSLYAVGFFHTSGGANDEVPLAEDMREILAEWKRDQQQLLKRFDANHDGQIDMAEWNKAREAARSEALAERSKRATKPGVDILARPPDGRPYILAAMDQSNLARRYRLLAVLGIAAFLALGAAAVYLLQVRLGVGSP